MFDNARKTQRHYRRNCGRNQKGGDTPSYSVGSPVWPANPSIGAAVVAPQGCQASTPSGFLPPPVATGLPGMHGGNVQRGGRYGFDVAAGMPVGNGAALSQGGYPEVVRLGGCEAAQRGGDPANLYTAPTAGYEQRPSDWVGADGTPVELRIPLAARIPNPACLKTGGAKRKHRRAGRRTQKRKGSRKTRRLTRARQQRKH